jgi:hypothetical protein
MVVNVNIERTLKGTLSSRTTAFTYSVPKVPTLGGGGVGVSAGQFGVFFLRSDGSTYEVVDPDFLFVIASPGAPETSGPVLDQVTAEVAHILDSPTASDRLKEQAISVLAWCRTDAATAALRTAANSQPINVRLGAMGVLLAQNDTSVLLQAQQLLLSTDARVEESMRENVASAIGYGVRDAGAVPLLAPLLGSPNVLVRRGAASALRNTRSRSAITPLAQALSDSDHNVEYYAVIGMAEITGTVGEWAPALSSFMEDPQRYLDHWQEWANSQK